MRSQNNSQCCQRLRDLYIGITWTYIINQLREGGELAVGSQLWRISGETNSLDCAECDSLSLRNSIVEQYSIGIR